jgi:hypothetical protein
MSKLYLVPIIKLFDVHDVAIREWLNELDDAALHGHLDFPFSLDRYFPEGVRHALKSVEDIHYEILRLLDIINPQAVFLDISVDFVELENKYNKRRLSPLEFWSEYYQISANTNSSHSLYCIYIKGIIDKEIRLIENKEHLPFSMVFYGTDIKTREELIPVYTDAFDKDGEFLLKAAMLINEMTNLRETPKHLWYTPMQERQTAISYEETEKFYNEFLNRLERLLKFKVREHFVNNLRDKAFDFISAYEKFLEYKMREDEIKFSNILEGLKVLISQSKLSEIVIFCGPMQYCALLNSLKNELQLSAVALEDLDITGLLNKMKPFTQKNRIMQSDYDIALNILGRKKTEKFRSHSAYLTPSK